MLHSVKHKAFQLARRITPPSIKRLIRRVVPPKNRQRICLVLCVYNEEKQLPYYLRHIEPYVDMIVALDDGSTDSTKQILKSSKKLKCLIERPQKNEIGDWNEIANREELLKKAQDLGADWALALDPDERFENNFLKNLRHIVETSDNNTVFGLRFRELWDGYDQFRVDGVWGGKQRFCLFPLNREIVYEVGRQKLHWRWYPDSLAGHEQLLDYDMYHLKMVMPHERVKRAELYNSLDPEKQYQAIGYDYLIDETGLRLQKVSADHAYDYESIPDFGCQKD